MTFQNEKSYKTEKKKKKTTFCRSISNLYDSILNPIFSTAFWFLNGPSFVLFPQTHLFSDLQGHVIFLSP